MSIVGRGCNYAPYVFNRADVDNLGYELVRVTIQGTRRQTVQVMIERKDGCFCLS